MELCVQSEKEHLNCGLGKTFLDKILSMGCAYFIGLFPARSNGKGLHCLELGGRRDGNVKSSAPMKGGKRSKKFLKAAMFGQDQA